MSLDYASEKFMVAVHSMAVSIDRLQKRLEYAYSSFHTLSVDDFPTKELKDAFAEIMKRLTADKSDSEEGYVPRTLRLMSDADSRDLAERIVSLYHAIESERHAVELRKVGRSRL